MITKSVAEINKYVGSSVNPMTTPDQIYELYSVPSFESGSPEIVSGADIGSTKVVVEDGDILICKINPRINRVWVVHHNTEYPLLASSEWIVVRNATMNSDYLKWYFSSPIFHTLLTSQVTGIGGSLTRAQPKQVAKYPVPIPSRDEQDYVANILTCIDNLIRKYQQCIISIDQLVKSRFIELFGDPKQNPKGYPVKEFDEISVLITDGEHATPRRTDKGIYLLSARNILNHALQLDDVDYIDEEEYTRIARRVVPQAGDVLISCSGSIGRCCVVPEELRFQMVRSAALIRFDDTINPVFAEWLITSDELQRQISMSATQSSQANLFQGKIRKLRGYVPPMELQEQFAAFVEQTDKSKFYIVQMQILLRLLIRAIQQKTTEVLL